jgi:hypothetical protein
MSQQSAPQNQHVPGWTTITLIGLVLECAALVVILGVVLGERKEAQENVGEPLQFHELPRGVPIRTASDVIRLDNGFVHVVFVQRRHANGEIYEDMKTVFHHYRLPMGFVVSVNDGCWIESKVEAPIQKPKHFQSGQ